MKSGMFHHSVFDIYAITTLHRHVVTLIIS